MIRQQGGRVRAIFVRKWPGYNAKVGKNLQSKGGDDGFFRSIEQFKGSDLKLLL
jgi:hypothetical protein